jgi:uncharacterized protein (UPF0218 family)
MRLKEPLGTLIRGSFADVMSVVKSIVEKEKPICVVSVGDTVSRNLVKSQIIPQVSIIDNKCMRRKVQEPAPCMAEKLVHVRNPQATITNEAINTVKEALGSNDRVRIVVDGEEDLLTLVAVLHAPLNSIVLYGQPYEGVVLIRVTPQKKAEFADILKEMTTS